MLELLSAAMDLISEGVLLVDNSLQISFMNTAAEWFTGVSAGDVVGQFVADAWPVLFGGKLAVKALLLPAGQMVSSATTETVVLRDRHGAERAVECDWRPLGHEGAGLVLLREGASQPVLEREPAAQEDWIDLRDLRAAVRAERFELFGQRITPLAARDGRGSTSDRYEVLIRLRGVDGELYSPGVFLPVAEHHGLIREIDRIVVDTSLAMIEQHCARHWEGNKGACGFNINLSAQSLSDPGFAGWLVDRVERHAVPPSALCFEITETMAVTNVKAARRLIDLLSEVGCEFALDDFGSGFSSFAYLHKFNVQYLKIDGSLVRDMLNDDARLAVIQSIQQMGAILGMKTIAEFAEDDATVGRLAQMGVDYAQGYAIGYPESLRAILSRACGARPLHAVG